jgi:hypothetical protein
VRPGIALPENEERAQHLFAIQWLSEQHRLPAADVAVLYERELASLKAGAQITSYLSIFATRRVNELLRTAGTAPAPSGSAPVVVQ